MRLGLLGLLDRLLLRLRRRGHRQATDVHLVKELRELGRGEKHASEVGEASILLAQSTVVETEIMGLVGSGGNFTLKLTNVFCMMG